MKFRASRLALVAATAIVAAGSLVAIAGAATASGTLKTGQTIYFIPKDTLNPYEVIADQGGKISLTAIGDKQVVSSGTSDTAAAQEPSASLALPNFDPPSAGAALVAPGQAVQETAQVRFRASHLREHLTDSGAARTDSAPERPRSALELEPARRPRTTRHSRHCLAVHSPTSRVGARSSLSCGRRALNAWSRQDAPVDAVGRSKSSG